MNHEFPGGGSDTLIEFYEEVFAASSQPLSDQITFMTHHDPNGGEIRPLRYRSTGLTDGSSVYYPALSVPLGPADELSCPPEHREFLRDRLTGSDELNLLVIGYSALDESVLKFLKDSTRPVGLVSIVSEQAALSVGTAVCRSDRGANDHWS